MTNSNFGSKVLFTIAVVVIVGVGIVWAMKERSSSVSIPGYTSQSTTSATATHTPTPSGSTTTPKSFSLAVPFTPQAPTANWDELHNEACEEASALMAAAYLKGDTRADLPAAEVEQQISILTKWQQDNFGYNLDTTAAETAQMIEGVYGLHTNLVKNFTEQDIKNALVAGHVVIIPVNGQKLGNPYFRQPGPIYHMLVIRGYDGDTLITNDSGTRNGKNYKYSFAAINAATADWDHGIDTIDESKSVMIVVSK